MAPRCAWHEAHVKRVRRRERTRLNHRQTRRLVTSEIVPAHKHNTGARLAWSWDYPIHLDLPSGSALNRCAHVRGARTAHGLLREFGAARHALGLGDDALAELARASVRASCAPAELKSRLIAEIDMWLALD